jgi:hypothetical protein
MRFCRVCMNCRVSFFICIEKVAARQIRQVKSCDSKGLGKACDDLPNLRNWNVKRSSCNVGVSETCPLRVQKLKNYP